MNIEPTTGYLVVRLVEVNMKSSGSIIMPTKVTAYEVTAGVEYEPGTLVILNPAAKIAKLDTGLGVIHVVHYGDVWAIID